MDWQGTGPCPTERQAAICFGNIDALPAEAGMGRGQMVHVRAYVTDRVHMAGYMAARNVGLADVAVLPTSTLVIVAGFSRPDFVVEIEVAAA